MTLYELCKYKYKTDPKYRTVCDGLKRRSREISRITAFLVLERNWPKEEANQRATDIVCPTLRHLA